VHVSVQRQALTRSGYPSLIDGLDDLQVRRIEMDMALTCEVPRLDGAGAARLSVAHESGARSYRQHLYEQAITLSAIRLASPTGVGLGAAEVDEIEMALYAADTAGAPVLCVEIETSPEAWPQGLASGLEHLAERGAGLRVIPAVALRPCNRLTIEAALAGDPGEPPGPGLALDIGDLFGGEASAEGAYELLRRIAPHIRHVVCRGSRIDGEGAPAAQGTVDYARVAAILGRAGYAGALTVALPEGGADEPLRDILRADVRYVADIVGAGPY